jgi:signal transduction histidine kinase
VGRRRERLVVRAVLPGSNHQPQFAIGHAHRRKSIELNAETAGELPAVFGYGSEINQVWETLIDNAIDAKGA